MQYKYTYFLFFVFFQATIAQSIEVLSYGENPLEVHPLIGGELVVNYTYTSEANADGNHIYIGLELFDASGSFQSVVSGQTLQNQAIGTGLLGTVTLFVGSVHALTKNLPLGYSYKIKAILSRSQSWEAIAIDLHENLILEDTSGYVFSINDITKGVDISWMTELEDSGFVWKDKSGNTSALLPVLKEYQLNAVRLRVWVAPFNSYANGYCSIEDTVEKAKIAAANGFDLLLSIHYSDWWADPANQTVSETWADFTVDQLEAAVYKHTMDVLDALKLENITPKWVQIGNETNNGMLWEHGKASEPNGFNNYATFVNAGMQAVKDASEEIGTVLHLGAGTNNDLCTWNIDGLIANGFKIEDLDVIGLSLYPDTTNWKESVDELTENIVKLKDKYDKDILVAEVGFDVFNTQLSYQLLRYLIEKTKTVNGLGVFYWEPIAYPGWKSYYKGAWNADGTPSIALEAFIDSFSTFSIPNTKKNLELECTSIETTSDSLLIVANRCNDISLYVYNMLGIQLFKIKSDYSTIAIDISQLTQGLYILKSNNGFSRFFQKVKK